MSANIVRLMVAPEPSLNNPTAQLKWIFFQVGREYEGTSEKMFSYALTKYLRYIDETSAYYSTLVENKRFFLNRYWEADALIRFNRWLEIQPLKSKTRYGIYKCVRRVMDFAYALRITDVAVYHAPMYKGVVETEQRTAYKPRHQEVINAALGRWLALAINLTVPYVPKGTGVPFRPGSKGGSAQCEPPRSSNASPGGPGKPLEVEGVAYASVTQAAAAYGVERGVVSYRLRRGCTPEQAVGVVPIYVAHDDERALLWRLENVYSSDPLAMLEDFRQRKLPGCPEIRMRKLFVRWGVWPHVDDRLIMPMVVELAKLTALNVESLKLLEIDSYIAKHPLTGQSALRYIKKRSASASRSADRVLHIAALEADELYIDSSIAQQVHNLLDLIIKTTARIRQFAPPEFASRLFIFEDVRESRRRQERVIIGIDPRGKASTWYDRFKAEEGLTEIFGEKFNFNIARCRPTVATNMVLAGASLFQVQAALDHEDIQTTVGYLEERQLRPKFNKLMTEKLSALSDRSRKQSVQSKASVRTVIPIVEDKSSNFLDTLSGVGCSNPFSPSDNVKSATKFQDGNICKFWNMCLLCDTAVITERSLPKLIIYGDRIKEALRVNSPSIQGKKSLLKQLEVMIQSILEPDQIFPEEVIQNAKSLAATMDDVLADHLIYQGM